MSEKKKGLGPTQKLGRGEIPSAIDIWRIFPEVVGEKQDDRSDEVLRRMVRIWASRDYDPKWDESIFWQSYDDELRAQIDYYLKEWETEEWRADPYPLVEEDEGP